MCSMLRTTRTAIITIATICIENYRRIIVACQSCLARVFPSTRVRQNQKTVMRGSNRMMAEHSAAEAKKSAASKSGDDPKRIARSLRQLMQCLDTYSRRLMKSHDITSPQLICLDALREKGTMTTALLANAIHISPSTTVGIVDRLESKKYVTRTRGSTDRRSVFVEITELGREFVLASPHLLHNYLKGAMVNLPKSEQLIIADSLDRLALLLREYEINEVK